MENKIEKITKYNKVIIINYRISIEMRDKNAKKNKVYNIISFDYNTINN